MTASWPTSVATDTVLFIAVDFPNSVTTLLNTITSGTSVIPLTNVVNFPTSGGFILIDSELIKYVGISGNNLTGCIRGIENTSMSVHNARALVSLVSMAEHHNALKDEIIAIENSLNLTPNLALISDASGRVDVSSTTDTELGYVHGVTSAIQTQLGTKIDTAGTGLSKSGTTLNLVTPVSVINGGTGQTTYTDGQLLIGNSTGNTLNKTTLTGTTSQVIVTNGSGTITLSTPQDIALSSSPTFVSETLTATTNQLVLGTTRTVTITAPEPASTSRTVTIPDLAASYSVVGTEGTQIINGIKTFGSAISAPAATLSNTTNQLILGTTNTTTITSSAPTSSRIYTIPDVGTTANMVLDQGNYIISGTWTFNNNVTLASSKALVLTDDSTHTITLQATNSTTSYTLKLPTTAGAMNQYLTTDGSGNCTWSNAVGSGTVNTGTQYQLAYYATSTDAVSGLTLITGNKAVVSDVNGLPVASTTTDTQIGYLSNVTSDVQEQITEAQLGALLNGN